MCCQEVKCEAGTTFTSSGIKVWSICFAVWPTTSLFGLWIVPSVSFLTLVGSCSHTKYRSFILFFRAASKTRTVRSCCWWWRPHTGLNNLLPWHHSWIFTNTMSSTFLIMNISADKILFQWNLVNHDHLPCTYLVSKYITTNFWEICSYIFTTLSDTPQQLQGKSKKHKKNRFNFNPDHLSLCYYFIPLAPH